MTKQSILGCDISKDKTKILEFYLIRFTNCREFATSNRRSDLSYSSDILLLKELMSQPQQ